MMKVLPLVYCISGIVTVIDGFKLGFIVDENDCCIKNMIDYSLNKSTGINNGMTGLRYEPVLIKVTKMDNTYTLGQKVCRVLDDHDILAIFSSDDSVMDGYIKSMSYNFEVPYIKIVSDQFTRYDPNLTINFYPVIDDSILQVMKGFRWKKTVLVYSGNSGYLRMISLSKILTAAKMQVKLHEVNTALDIHKMFKLTKDDGWPSYTVDLSLNKTQMFLNVALMEGMIRVNHSFMFLNMDVQLLDMTSYQHNEANITTFALHHDNQANNELLRHMAVWSAKSGRSLFAKPDTLTVSSMLMYDAIQTFIRAMEGMSYGNTLQLGNSRVSCSEEITLEIGSSIFNYLNAVQWPGLSGAVRLDAGKRLDYSVDVVQLVEYHGLQKLSEYRVVDGTYKQVKNDIKLPYARKNRTLIVTGVIEEPFLMHAQSLNNHPLEGNERYSGFCADLLKKIADELGFTYRIEICVNCTYGAPDEAGQWGGMVGELVNQRADLALGSFTISYMREQVIDFSKPFMHVGISILYKVPNKETPGLFSFMEPLALETWFFVVLAYLIVSLSLYMLGRFSPYEHISQDMTSSADGSLITVRNFHLTLANSFWFAVGTLMQQGSDVSPAAASTRIVGGFWWLFSLFVISSYTANLAAFLTVERMVTPIEDAEGLSLQTSIKYGTLGNGSTWLFFKESNIETYKRMWTFMSANPSVFVDSYDAGVKRVKEEDNYALLMESAALDYKSFLKTLETSMAMVSSGHVPVQATRLKDTSCIKQLKIVFACMQDSPWRDLISDSILKLQESGDIHQLYDKWWKQPGMCGRDHQGKSESVANALDMQNVGGIFIILFTGMVLAVIVAVVEYLYHKKKPIPIKKLIPYKAGDKPQGEDVKEKFNNLDRSLSTDSHRNSPSVYRQVDSNHNSMGSSQIHRNHQSPMSNHRLPSQQNHGPISGHNNRPTPNSTWSPQSDDDYSPPRSVPNISVSQYTIGSQNEATERKCSKISECGSEEDYH